MVSESPALRLLQITNPTKLELALDALVSMHRWSVAFLAANPKRKWSEQEINLDLNKNPADLQNIAFGDMLELRAVAIQSQGDETTVRLWWRPLQTIQDSDWAFFIHLLNNKDDMLMSISIPIYRISDLNTLGNHFIYSETSFRNPPNKGSNRLGIGVSNTHQIIRANQGIRDMDGQRVIIPKL